MELIVWLEGGGTDHHQFTDYEVSEDQTLDVMTPTGFTVCTYNADKWIQVRRVLEKGEDWPVTEEIPDVLRNLENGGMGPIASAVVRGVPFDKQ